MKTAPSPAGATLMPVSGAPEPLQRGVVAQLGAALQSCLKTSAPSSDGGGLEADKGPQATPWLAPRVDIAAASRKLSPVASQSPLYLRCLVHYRDALRPQDREQDDAGVALACMLAASLQALEAHAVTPERWARITLWLQQHVVPGVDWGQAPTSEQQDFFARMALLAVALGEWSLEASKRGATAQATAHIMARQHLQVELGLDHETLLKAMRWLDVIPASES